MKILRNYLISEFLKPFFLSAFAFGGLVLISEFFRELNYYLEKKASFIAVFQYLAFNLPWWVIQVLPVAVLLAVLFSLGNLSKTGEITAMKAAGINMWRLIGIFFSIGIIIGVLDVALREYVIPYSVYNAQNIRAEKIAKENIARSTDYYNLFIALPDNGNMTIAYLNTSNSTATGIIIDYHKEHALTKQIVSQSGQWKDNKWLFSNGTERLFDSSKLTSETLFETKEFNLPIKPEDFIIIEKRPEEMSSKQFNNYIKQLETLGIPSEKERIQLNLRWASVFSHVIVMMIGIPFALGFGSKHGKILSFTFALVFAFVYWSALAIGQSLGENRIVSPVMAAWFGNAIFGVLGIAFLFKVQK